MYLCYLFTRGVAIYLFTVPKNILPNKELNFSPFLVYLSIVRVWQKEGDFFHHHHHRQRKVERHCNERKRWCVRYKSKCGLTKHSATLFEELLRWGAHKMLFEYTFHKAIGYARYLKNSNSINNTMFSPWNVYAIVSDFLFDEKWFYLLVTSWLYPCI